MPTMTPQKNPELMMYFLYLGRLNQTKSRAAAAAAPTAMDPYAGREGLLDPPVPLMPYAICAIRPGADVDEVADPGVVGVYVPPRVKPVRRFIPAMLFFTPPGGPGSGHPTEQLVLLPR